MSVLVVSTTLFCFACMKCSLCAIGDIIKLWEIHLKSDFSPLFIPNLSNRKSF